MQDICPRTSASSGLNPNSSLTLNLNCHLNLIISTVTGADVGNFRGRQISGEGVNAVLSVSVYVQST